MSVCPGLDPQLKLFLQFFFGFSLKIWFIDCVFKYLSYAMPFIATTYKFEIMVLGTAIQNLPLFNDFICIKTKEASQGQRIDIFMKLH